MKFKRYLSLFLSFVMLFYCCQITSFAGAGLVEGKDKAKISFEYLVEDSTETSGYKEVDPAKLKTNDTFFVGVKTVDFPNIKEVDEGVLGITDITVGLAYDNRYLYAEPNNRNDNGKLTGTKLNGAVKSRLTYTGSILEEDDNGYSYELDFAYKSNSMYNGINENKDVIYVSLSSQALNDSYLSGYKGEKDLYIAIIEFKVIDVPSAATTVFAMSENNEETVLKFGFTGTDADGEEREEGLYQYSLDGESEDIATVIDFDFSHVNVFPAYYDVEFYNSYDADTASYGDKLDGKTITVPETKSVDYVVSSTADTDNPVTVPVEADFTAPEGKYFNGLKYVDKDGDVKAFDSSATLNETFFESISTDATTTLKVYADWVDGKTITFNSNYPAGTIAEAKTKDVSIAPTATKIDADKIPTTSGETPDFATPDGYAFAGWYTDAACTDSNKINFDTNEFKDGDQVYAKWVEMATITFYPNDGTGESGAGTAETAQVTPGTSIAEDDIPTPTRENYDFVKWTTNQNGTGASYTADAIKTATFADDTTLYAQWEVSDDVAEENKVTLTFDTNGGSTPDPASITVFKGDQIFESQLPTPTKTSATGVEYTFEGWYEEASASNTDKFTFPLTLTEDDTAYAHWKYEGTDQITITFNDQSATTPVSPTSLVIGKGDAIGDAMPTAPKKDGNSFGGWYKDADCTDENKVDGTTTFDANTTLYAKWIEDVTFTYVNNDGTETTTSVTAPAGDVYKDPTAPTRENYDFAGWNTASNGSGDTIAADGSATNAEIAAKTTDNKLYAQWTATGEDKVTLTFDANLDGVTPDPSTVTVNKNDKVYEANIPVVSKDDYTFDGWYASPSITDTDKIDFSAGYTVDESKTVYAHWTYTGTDAVTVTFMNDSDTYATVKVAPNTQLGTMMPTEPAKTGFAFKEWNTSSDGTGTKFDKDTNVTATITVYAQWTEDITVNYDANGGTDAPESVKKPAADKYADPDVTSMTNDSYTFVGWNTEKNGSGTYVKADDTLTYADVADFFIVDGGTAPTTVTLYAQWAYVPEDKADDVIDDDPVDPKENGVKVTFDSNAAGATTTVTDANPMYKYPKLGDAIGEDNMPNNPTRDKYTFKGWNTKQDGTGTLFTGATTVDSATLGDALVEITDASSKYAVTVYAQWEVADDVDESEKVTVTFNKNLDGTGAAGDVVKTVTLYKGDALGYDVEAPTNDKYEFNGWYAGSVADGKVSFTENKFTSTTAINADTDYYAQWQMFLLVEPQETEYTYTGSVIDPEIKVYKISSNTEPYDKGDVLYSGKASELTKFKFTFTKDSAVADLKDVGTYTVKAEFADTSLSAMGAQIAVTNPVAIEIKAKGLTVKVDPETQINKGGDGTGVTLSVGYDVDGTFTEVTNDGTIYKVVYYKWTDSNSNGKIDDSELTAETGIPTDVAEYVVKVELQDTNYSISEVVSTGDGTVSVYGTDVYADGKTGENIKFSIIPNDPSISTIAVKSVDNVDADGGAIDPAVEENLDLKQSDYTTNQAFDNAETPTVKDYYIRVTDTDADEVTFTITLTNADTTTLTAVGGTATKNDDGTYTVKAPLTNKGAAANVVTITTKAGDAEDAPTIAYTFNIQQLVEAKIVLNYGNSPYGEIMKDSAITDKDAAKEAFNSGNKFATGFTPANAANNKLYSPKAWGNATDSSINLDRNDYSIFIYNKKSFKDPGFTATDALGNSIADTDVTRNITIKRMSANSASGMKDANVTDETITITGQANDATIADITSGTKGVRPGSYSMEYSFTDPVTSEVVKIERPVVVIWQIGDADLSTIRNAADASSITGYVKGTSTPTDGVDTASANIFFYRIMDVDHSGIINAADASNTTAIVKGSSSEVLFYNELK